MTVSHNHTLNVPGLLNAFEVFGVTPDATSRARMQLYDVVPPDRYATCQLAPIVLKQPSLPSNDDLFVCLRSGTSN